jgi:hypothetical protein
MDVDEPGASPRLPPEPYHSLAEAPLGSPGTETTRYKRERSYAINIHKLSTRPN